MAAGAKAQCKILLPQRLAGPQLAIEYHSPEFTDGRFDRILVRGWDFSRSTS
jgi:hypothetical protein